LYEFFAVVVGLHVAVFTPCPYSVISLIRIVNVHRDLAASGTDVIPDLLHRDSLTEPLHLCSYLREQPKSKLLQVRWFYRALDGETRYC